MNVGLIKGRHEIPEVNGLYIFNEPVDPTDVIGINEIAIARIKQLFNNPDKERSMNLYVTGLTVALVAVINACRMYHIKLILWHYNKNTNRYFPQVVC
jgi:hypothetical protein